MSSDRDPPPRPQRSTLRGSFDRSIPTQTTEPSLRVPIPDPASEPPAPAAPSASPHAADQSLSQIRTLLFGELQAQHEERLRRIEDELAILRNESRAQLESWVGHFTNELNDLTNSTKSRLDSIDETMRTQTAHLNARIDDNAASLMSELQSLRAGFSAISTVVMDEIKDAETRLLEEMTGKTTALRDDLAKLFIGASRAMSPDLHDVRGEPENR